jgi:tetratricopeptide (TPR) repeat protein
MQAPERITTANAWRRDRMTSDASAPIAAARHAIKAGDLATAEALANQALVARPTDIDAIEVIALVAMQRGDHGAAEKALRSAIALAPGRRWPYADLVRLLLKLGRTGEAEEVAQAALNADPDNPDAHAMLGSILAERELWQEAATHFDRAIALAGEHPQLLTGLARTRMRQGRLDEARSLLERSVSADPDALEPAAYLAEALERLGELEKAARQLDRAEAIARRQGTDVDLQRSVLLGRMGKPEEAVALLEGKPELSGAARLQLGRLYEKLGRYADAWDEWVHGKAELAGRNGRRYRAAEVQAEAGRVLCAAAKSHRAASRDDVAQPIFIVGFPRSGTTLTEQILASHSAIRAGGELPFGPELHELSRKGFADATQLRDHYLTRAEESGVLAPGARYFTDKMPDNAFWLPLLRTAFPDSPVVLLHRHPLDVLRSVMAHDMTHGFNCGYRLEDAATHLALVDDLLERYRVAGVGPTFDLTYEVLVGDQARETARLMAAIGLDIEPAQLDFHQRNAVSPTPSYAQVTEPLNDRSIGRWRHFARQLEPIVPIVSKAMERSGYAG